MVDQVCSLQANSVCADIAGSEASLDFSLLLLRLSLAIADGTRSFTVTVYTCTGTVLPIL